MNFVYAAIGTSLKSMILLRHFYRAAHCTSSSFGKSRRINAKATRNTSFSKLCQNELANACQKVGVGACELCLVLLESDMAS